MDLKLWAILHDGDVESISGTVPGEAVLHVNLGWVAEEFDGASGSLKVILRGCTGIEYVEFGSNSSRVGIAEMQGLDIEILSASRHGEWVEVVTTRGLLKLRYAGVTVELDTGRGVTLDELTTAVNRNVQTWLESQQRAL